MGSTILGYQYEIIQEDVSSKDVFPHKTHEGIKYSLFKLITTSDSSCTIGLEGQWGAGKSTVIHLLKEEFSKSSDKRILFFTFDAWAHEGDPLRKVFLETLISNIEQDHFLSNLLKEITGLKKTVEVHTSKKTSKFADYLAIFTLLVPIGAAILSAIDYKGLYGPWSSQAVRPHLPFIFGLLLSLAPLFVVLFWGLFSKKNSKGERDWSLLASNSTENYTQNITEEGEKSSVEFEKLFSRILSYVIDDKSLYDKAIIVVDNLDRVDSSHARQLWSTLQPFFIGSRQDLASSWKKKVWFIVPYDREGLSKIWDYPDSSSQQPTSEVAISFLSKSFQIVAEVPSPVLSGWSIYLLNAADRSLRLWPELDREQVVNTFKKYASKLEISPTPRQINNFINKVGFMGLRWGGFITSEAIALYVLLRTKYSETELRGVLISSSDIPEKYEATNDEIVIKQELAGLLFGVPKSAGLELLLKPEIQRAASTGDSSLIKQLIETHSEAFWITWTAIKSEILPTPSHTEDYRAAATKAILEAFCEANTISKVRKDLDLIEKVWKQTVDIWRFDTKVDYFGALTVLYEYSKDQDETISWLKKAIGDKLLALISTVGAGEVNQEVFKQIKLFEEFFQQKGAPLRKVSYPYLNLDRWLAWEVFLETNAYALKIVLPNAGVITDLGNQYLPAQYQIPESNIKSLIYLNELNPDSDEWDGVLNNILVWSGRGGNRELGNNFAYVLMLRLFANEKHKKRFNEAANMNQFWQNSSREPIDDKSYISVLAGVCFEDRLQNVTYINDEIKRYWTETINSAGKKSFVFDILTETGNRSILWSMLKSEKNKLAIELIEENKDVEELFDSDQFFLSLGEYYIERKQAKLYAQKFLKNGVFEKARDHLSAQPIEYAYVLSLLQNVEEANIRNYVNRLVESLSRDTWKTAFDSDSWLLNCVINKEVKLDHKYRDAFEEFFVYVIEGNARGSEWQWNNFSDLFAKAIDKNKLLKKLIANYFDSEIDSLDDQAFNGFREVIRGQLKNINMPKVMDRLILWIDQKKWSRIEWLTDLNLVYQDVPEGLQTRLIELKSSEEPIVKNAAIKLITALNIDLNII